MRKLVLFAPLAVVLTAVAAFAAADMADYCQVPPTVSTIVPPNILLMVDGTGSMGTKAYTSSTYNAANVYEGYFDPEQEYVKDDNGIWVEKGSRACTKTCTVTCQASNLVGTCGPKNGTLNGTSCSGAKYPCCIDTTVDLCPELDNGNHLNYLNMTRMDGIHWALTGGTPLGCNGTVGRCDVSQIPPGQLSGVTPNVATCDAAGCVLTMYNSEKVKARWDRLTGNNGGLLYKLQGLPVQPRIGLMLFDGETAASAVSGNVLIGDFKPTGPSPPSYDAAHPYQNTIAMVNAKNPGGSTPTGPAMQAAKAYFAQESAVNGGPTPQSVTGGVADPATRWKNPLYQCIDKDGDKICAPDEMVLMTCAKNFIILLSDGEWNVPNTSTTSDPVLPAYAMHYTGLNNVPTSTCNPLTNVNCNQTKITSIYSIGLWLAAGSSGERAMHHIAMYGGFDTDNKNREWPGGTTTTPTTSLTVLLPNPSFPDWDKNGDRIPDNYLSASSASEIKNQIATIILDLMKKASSGTAASVVGSSDGSGAIALQTLFYPKRAFKIGDVAWTSDLMSYWYYMDPYFSSMNIYEDTVREGGTATPPYTLLDLKQDYITSFIYDSGQDKTLANLWEGSATDANKRGQRSMDTSRAIWRAGFNLWWTEPSDRTVYTSLDGSTLTPFTAANGDTLAPYLGQSSSTDAEAIIRYVRGSDCVDASGADCTCGTAGCGCTDDSGAPCACGDPACTGGAKIGRSRTVATGVCSARKSPCDSGADCPAGEACVDETHVWKMGDIVSATPRLMGAGPLNTFNRASPAGYNDQSYSQFIKSNDYQERQLVFSGTNDGMFHAFRLGKILQKWVGKNWTNAKREVARLEGGTGSGGIGTEVYAFIPRNVLPYLQYLKEEDYPHIYMVDGPITLIDAAINKTSSCTAANYWDCPKITTMTAADSKDVDFANTSWRAVVIGSMGIGGATSDSTGIGGVTCVTTTSDPSNCRIKTPLAVNGQDVGWSSYFALDVTNQATPKLLWEFSHPDLGVTNVGPAIVKVGGKDKRCSNNASQTCSINSDCGTGTPPPQCVTTNGKWFAVLASGSTGPIDNSEFKGLSNQYLKLFILDLATGKLACNPAEKCIITTDIDNGFVNSISSTVDLERDKPSKEGNYQDDVLYLGYVQKDTVSKEFNKGGVGRLVMNDDSDPANWKWSKVFADGEIGPVTSSVATLIDRNAKKLWIYFGEGRYFYRQDDIAVRRKLVGVQDPCFNDATNAIDSTLSTCAPLQLSQLQDRTSLTLPWDSANKGWFIQLKKAAAATSAERVIAKPAIDPQGAIFFSSIAPNADICGVGGNSRLWAVDYRSGGRVTYLLQGKVLLQTSTGEVKEVDLSKAFGNTDDDYYGGRASEWFPGLSQGDPTMFTNPPPVKRFMHIQEE